LLQTTLVSNFNFTKERRIYANTGCPLNRVGTMVGRNQGK